MGQKQFVNVAFVGCIYFVHLLLLRGLEATTILPFRNLVNIGLFGMQQQ